MPSLEVDATHAVSPIFDDKYMTGRTPLWDFLDPRTARGPRIVREYEVLRVAATIAGGDPSVSADSARREVLKWAQRRSAGRLPEDAWEQKGFEHLSGGRNSVGVRLTGDETDIWGIRADDPDKEVPGRTWTTEVVIGLMNNEPARFSTRLLVSTSEDEFAIQPHTPGLVHQVAEHCGLLRGTYDITPDPWLVCTNDDVEKLIDTLLDPMRKQPVFVLTVPENNAEENLPLLNAPALARATIGIATVAILPAQFTGVLTQRFEKIRSVFGGAIRAYLPGFSRDGDPYAHRLVLAKQILAMDGALQCDRWMRALAATESIKRLVLGRDVLAFAAIRSASIIARQTQLAIEGGSDSDQLEVAKAHIQALDKQHEDDKISIEYFDQEYKRAEERAEAAEEQARASTYRIQQLLEQIDTNDQSPVVENAPPNSWGSFVNWCDTNLAGRLTLTASARRQLRAPKFDNPLLAARCLIWLATECRSRRMVGGEGSLREEVVEPGVRNSHCGGDQFDLDWQGQRYTADWHIKGGGNTHDPSRCLRIYYFWEPTTQQIVVAEMPGHRRTSMT